MLFYSVILQRIKSEKSTRVLDYGSLIYKVIFGSSNEGIEWEAKGRKNWTKICYQSCVQYELNFTVIS